ncbi:MAG: DUF1926 domain-containing protein [Deltaproteobacteria bacterium]|nr:DUF1926 domain-containing protein [Deltaproteobacteria bacterium]
MKQLHLILTLHGHQPAGNPADVVQQAIRECYRPMIEAIDRHVSLKFCLHLSGSLLAWFERLAPDLLDRLGRLQQAERIEMLAGGFHAPILAILPETDALAQLAGMQESLNHRFGQVSRGAWIAEQLWEPQLCSLLAEAGIRYTFLDERLLHSDGMPQPRTAGYRMTEQAGQELAIFPIDSALCQDLPGTAVENLMRKLLDLSDEKKGGGLICLADDWEGVWQQSWMETFFQSLEAASDWLHTCTPSQWMNQHPAAGRAYPACGADGEAWRNFLIRYPEADRLYRKILAVSRKLAEAMEETELPDENCLRAQNLLHKGQDHKALWQGKFDGLYSPALRQAAYRHLLQAEVLLDQQAQGDEDWIAFDSIDYDADGHEEILVENRLINVLLAPNRGGRIEAIDHRTSFRCISDVKDPSARANFVDRFPAPGSALEDRLSARQVEEGDFAEEPYGIESLGIDEAGECDFEVVMFRAGSLKRALQTHPLQLTKRLRIPADRPELEVEVRLHNPADTPVDLHYCPEFNLSLDVTSQARIEFDGMTGPGPSTASVGEIADASWIALFEKGTGRRLRLSMQPAGVLWRHPIETQGRDKQGAERILQGLALGASWEMTLPPKAERTFRLRLEIQTLEADSVVPIPSEDKAT